MCHAPVFGQESDFLSETESSSERQLWKEKKKTEKEAFIPSWENEFPLIEHVNHICSHIVYLSNKLTELWQWAIGGKGSSDNLLVMASINPSVSLYWTGLGWWLSLDNLESGCSLDKGSSDIKLYNTVWLFKVVGEVERTMKRRDRL